MVVRKSLVKSTVQYTLSSVSTLFLFVLLIVAGRYLGAADFGRFSFALALFFLFDPILDPGLYHLLIREIARRKESAEEYLAHALTWKLFVAPFVFVLIVIFANMIQGSKLTLQAVYLMAIAGFLKSVKDSFRTTLLAHEYFGLDAISLGIERISLLLFGFWALVTGGGLLALCWVFVLVRLFDLVIIGGMVRQKVCKVHLGYDFSFVKALVISAIPIGGFYITINIYNYIDTVMISIFKSEAEVGWYNASYKLYEGLLIIPGIIGTVLMPRLSQLYVSGRDEFAELCRRGIKYICVVALLVAVNGILLSDSIITMLFGESYEASILSLEILLGGIVFVYLVNFLQTVMITADQQRMILYLAGCGLLVNVGLNVLLIPEYGYVGAAAATVIVEVMVCVLLFVYMHRLVGQIGLLNVLARPVICVLVPVLFILLFPVDLVYVKIGIINVSFVVLLYLTRVFDAEEMRAISGVLWGWRKTVEVR